MIYGSICSGIEAATTAWHPLGWTPAFFAENERFPSSVLKHHYPNTPNHGDITRFKDWPDYAIDLLVGGTPCQSFSIAGLRKGLDDARGNLMLTFGAIAAKYRPKWLVWENVPGVFSSDEGRDFASLLGLLAGQKITPPEDGWRTAGIVSGIDSAYGLAWRTLDAQYVRVESHPRAVPQRRRRVFVVGYLGDWRRAAAVLFERESMCGHPAPRRQSGQRPTGTLEARTGAGGAGWGTDWMLDGGVTAVPDVCGTISDGAHNGGGSTVKTPTLDASSLPEVAWALQERDAKSADSSTKEGHLIPMLRGGSFDEAGVARTLLGKPNSSHDDTQETYVTHSLTGEGNDASEDGSGRGTPIVAFDCKAGANTGFAIGEIPGALRGDGHGGGHAAIAFEPRYFTRDNKTGGAPTETPDITNCKKAGDSAPVVAFSCKDNGRVATAGVSPTLRGMGHSDSHANGGGQIAIAMHADEVAPTLISGPSSKASHGKKSGTDRETVVATHTAVRRLTPRECERLQGFPDDYTKITDKTADGPRYKALGNSMAVNVMRWIGERIQAVEDLTTTP